MLLLPAITAVSVNCYSNYSLGAHVVMPLALL